MFGSPTRTRTRDQVINSHSLYQLSYRGMYWRPKAPLAFARAEIFVEPPGEVKPTVRI